MTLLELKPLTAEYLGRMVELDRLCFGELWTLPGYQRELDSPNSELLGLFILRSGCPSLVGMGCLWAILEEAHITILAVDPQYQSQGFGQALLTALMLVARHRGLERATLEVRATNRAAIALYQKFGFKLAGRRRCYYRDTKEDALIFWYGGLQEPEFSLNLSRWCQNAITRLTAASWNLSEPFFLTEA